MSKFKVGDKVKVVKKVEKLDNGNICTLFTQKTASLNKIFKIIDIYEYGIILDSNIIYPSKSLELVESKSKILKVTEKDNINHPSHYKNHPSGIECIRITEHMNFCLGNAVKYIWRAGLKGNEIEDLKKAEWYIKQEIKRLKKELNK